MSEQETFCTLLRRVYAGDEEREAFHGPCVKAVLEGIDAGMATARPLEGAHTIWELVLHLCTWREFCAERIELKIEHPDRPLPPVPPGEPEGDWKPPADISEATWRETLERLGRSQERLLAAISRLTDEQIPEREPSLRFLIHHDLYHCGQIGLLKKGLS